MIDHDSKKRKVEAMEKEASIQVKGCGEEAIGKPLTDKNIYRKRVF